MPGGAGVLGDPQRMETGELHEAITEALTRLQRTMDRCVLGLYGGMDAEGNYREGLIGQVADLNRRVRDLESSKAHGYDWLRSVSFLGIGALFGKGIDWVSSHIK
jgi:hypothetical protein